VSLSLTHAAYVPGRPPLPLPRFRLPRSFPPVSHARRAQVPTSRPIPNTTKLAQAEFTRHPGGVHKASLGITLDDQSGCMQHLWPQSRCIQYLWMQSGCEQSSCIYIHCITPKLQNQTRPLALKVSAIDLIHSCIRIYLYNIVTILKQLQLDLLG
jgi:hypothetical protein